MKPLKDNVLVTQVEIKTETSSGIILGEAVESGSKPALIVAVGPDVKSVAIGDQVYLQWPKALAVSFNGDQAALISEEFIEAIL